MRARRLWVLLVAVLCGCFGGIPWQGFAEAPPSAVSAEEVQGGIDSFIRSFKDTYTWGKNQEEARSYLFYMANDTIHFYQNGSKGYTDGSKSYPTPEMMGEGQTWQKCTSTGNQGAASTPQSADFEHWPWREIGFRLSEPHFFQYCWEVVEKERFKIVATASFSAPSDAIWFIEGTKDSERKDLKVQWGGVGPERTLEGVHLDAKLYPYVGEWLCKRDYKDAMEPCVASIKALEAIVSEEAWRAFLECHILTPQFAAAKIEHMTPYLCVPPEMKANILAIPDNPSPSVAAKYDAGHIKKEIQAEGGMRLLEISTSPPGAKIRLGDEYVKKDDGTPAVTPFVVRLPADATTQMTLELAGYKNLKRFMFLEHSSGIHWTLSKE